MSCIHKSNIAILQKKASICGRASSIYMYINRYNMIWYREGLRRCGIISNSYFGVNVTCCEPKIDRMILLFKNKPVIRHGVSLLGISITYYVGHFTCVIQFENIFLKMLDRFSFWRYDLSLKKQFHLKQWTNSHPMPVVPARYCRLFCMRLTLLRWFEFNIL